MNSVIVAYGRPVSLSARWRYYGIYARTTGTGTASVPWRLRATKLPKAHVAQGVSGAMPLISSTNAEG